MIYRADDFGALGFKGWRRSGRSVRFVHEGDGNLCLSIVTTSLLELYLRCLKP